MDGLTGTKGGSGVWQRIISEMPRHDVYIEPFWGRGTIAKRKLPARYTIGVDLDPVAVASGHEHALMFLADGIQWVADYFRLPVTVDRASLDPDAAAGDAESRDRRQAQISAAGPGENGQAARNAEFCDFGRDVEFRDTSDACTFGGVSWERHFVYFDPPYLGCNGYYQHELTEDQHRVLCRLFRRLPCPAALSGYRTDVYVEELSDCRSIVIPTVNRAAKPVDEIVWLNFPKPLWYHDTRFIGSCRRQRERIRRRVKTWSAGLLRMAPAERQAVLEACKSVCQGPATTD